MRYAIDRYAVGTEKEVYAGDFENTAYIPRRTQRFFCPECGEKVFFRFKRGSKEFYHQAKTEKTPECDKRVDGRSGLSLRQRVGLNVYLKCIGNHFSLNIGFPALGDELLSKAASAHYSVQISAGKQSRTIQLNHINFLADTLTLVPIDFVPSYRRNYKISLAGDAAIWGLNRKWSNYADGFDFDGAIFTFEDTGGRKIRRGDSISTYRSYYALVRRPFPSLLGLHCHELGEIDLKTSTFKVVEFEIQTSLEDQRTFITLNEYFRNRFGVWLLECQPELIPIWPPVSRQDCIVPLLGNKITCLVSSSNSEPNVYEYSEYGVTKANLNCESPGLYTVDLSVGKTPLVLSVDRKYVGRETEFMQKKIERSNFEYDFHISDHEGETIEWDMLDRKMLDSELVFNSNSKIELFTGSSSMVFRHIAIRDPASTIPPRDGTQDFYLVIEGAIFRHFGLDEAQEEYTPDLSSLATAIQRNLRGTLLPIPRWAGYMFQQLINAKDKSMIKAIKAATHSGMVYSEVLKQLLLYQRQISHK